MKTNDLAASLAERFGRLEDRRSRWVPVWRELASYMLPRKDCFDSHSRPGAADERIFDSTPPHALELLASALGGLLTNLPPHGSTSGPWTGSAETMMTSAPFWPRPANA